MKSKYTYLLFVIALIINASGVFGRNTIANEYNKNPKENGLSLPVTQIGSNSCEVTGCGFSRLKTSCKISCSDSQIAQCECKCIKTTTFGTCLELQESCLCQSK